MTITVERYRGCLLGLATGDALGTTLEFRAPGTFTPIAEMLGGGPFNLKAGEWTDDTSMALCLAESLVERQSFDPLDQMTRYLRWYREGYLSSNGRCFDIGGTTRSALVEFERTRQPFCGSSAPSSAGNGSLMRLAPAAMAFAADAETAIDRCGQSSRTTHAAPAAVDACRYYGALLVSALNGADKETLLSGRLLDQWQQPALHPLIAEIAQGSFKRRQPPEIQGSGYVVKALEAALWAFDRSDDFRQGCLMAVNLGDDADTTGAIFGQLAGAFYGEQDIPPEWLEKLALREKIISLAEQLLEMAAR